MSDSPLRGQSDAPLADWEQALAEGRTIVFYCHDCQRDTGSARAARCAFCGGTDGQVTGYEPWRPVHLISGRNFTLFFGQDAPLVGYAIEVSSGRLFRNGELWGRVESIELDAFTTVRHVAYKRIENGQVVDA